MSVIMAETAKHGFRDGFTPSTLTEEEKRELSEKSRRSRTKFDEEFWK